MDIKFFNDETGLISSFSDLYYATASKTEFNSIEEFKDAFIYKQPISLNSEEIINFPLTPHSFCERRSVIISGVEERVQPVFDELSDKINGLTFCIDSFWGHKIELISYKKENNTYTANVKITFYDHFGLDSADIDKYGSLSGFRAWYTLQHAKHFNGAYKPFVTLIETNMQLTGYIN